MFGRVLGLNLLVVTSLFVCNGTATARADDQSLPAKLNDAARDFRIELYSAYRTQRAEYDQRRQMSEELIRSWVERGRREEELPLVLTWFTAARSAIIARQSLPQPPDWEHAALFPKVDRRNSFAPHQIEPVLVARINIRERNHASPNIIIINSRIAGRIQDRGWWTPPKRALQSELATASRWSRTNLVIDVRPRATIINTICELPRMPIVVPGRRIKPVDNGPVEINSAELDARIQGFRRGWKALQSDILMNDLLSIAQAERFMEVADDLTATRRALRLYTKAAPEDLQVELNDLPDPHDLLLQLRQRVRALPEATIASEPQAWQQIEARLNRALQ